MIVYSRVNSVVDIRIRMTSDKLLQGESGPDGLDCLRGQLATSRLRHWYVTAIAHVGIVGND